MYKIRKSHKAESDLIDIWLYSAERWDETQADTYLDHLETIMEALANNPELGTAYDHRPGYRKIRVKSHAFFIVLKTKRYILFGYCTEI